MRFFAFLCVIFIGAVVAQPACLVNEVTKVRSCADATRRCWVHENRCFHLCQDVNGTATCPTDYVCQTVESLQFCVQDSTTVQPPVEGAVERGCQSERANKCDKPGFACIHDNQDAAYDWCVKDATSCVWGCADGLICNITRDELGRLDGTDRCVTDPAVKTCETCEAGYVCDEQTTHGICVRRIVDTGCAETCVSANHQKCDVVQGVCIDERPGGCAVDCRSDQVCIPAAVVARLPTQVTNGSTTALCLNCPRCGDFTARIRDLLAGLHRDATRITQVDSHLSGDVVAGDGILADLAGDTFGSVSTGDQSVIHTDRTTRITDLHCTGAAESSLIHDNVGDVRVDRIQVDANHRVDVVVDDANAHIQIDRVDLNDGSVLEVAGDGSVDITRGSQGTIHPNATVRLAGGVRVEGDVVDARVDVRPVGGDHGARAEVESNRIFETRGVVSGSTDALIDVRGEYRVNGGDVQTDVVVHGDARVRVTDTAQVGNVIVDSDNPSRRAELRLEGADIRATDVSVRRDGRLSISAVAVDGPLGPPHIERLSDCADGATIEVTLSQTFASITRSKKVLSYGPATPFSAFRCRLVVTDSAGDTRTFGIVVGVPSRRLLQSGSGVADPNGIYLDANGNTQILGAASSISPFPVLVFSAIALLISRLL